MIISHEHNFVFLHNPKVAGSAIRKALEHLHDDQTVYWHQKFFSQLDRVVDAAHLTFHDFQAVHPFLPANYFTFFVVVRNPYERFLSGVLEHGRQHNIKFRDWRHIYWFIEGLSEAALRFDWKYIHLCPQHYFVPPNDVCGMGPGCVYVARHETLEQDWRWLNSNLKMDLQLPKVRVRPDPEHDDILLENMPGFVQAWINNAYFQDFQRFGYTMEGQPQMPNTHYERVNGIHSPYLLRPAYSRCTVGEQVAYNQIYGVHDGNE